MTDKTPPTDDDRDEALLKSLGLHEAGQRTRDALRPLGDDFQARMVDQIQAQLGTSGDPGIEDAPTDDALPDNVVRLERRPQRPWVAALAASALAAVGLAFVLGPMQSAPSIPQYTLEFRGGAVVRGDDDLAPLQVGDTLQAIVRPAEAFAGTPSLDVYRRDGEAFATVDANVQWADSGAARVTVVLDDSLPLGPQDWWFVVMGDAGVLGTSDLEALTPPASGEGWQVLRQRFELVP